MVSNVVDKNPQKISSMFNEVAPKYDFLNHLLSFNKDKKWRKQVLQKSKLMPAERVCDLACGTGDLTFEFASRMVGGEIIGLDFSEKMLEQARHKLTKKEFTTYVEFVQGDILKLPFPDEKFEIVTIGFGLRNVADIAQALKEMKRILKPGGRLLILEFTKPPNPLFRMFYHLYKNQIMPRIAKKVAGSAYTAYEYLDQSISTFPDARTLKNVIEQAGFGEVRFFFKTMGVVAIHRGVKP